MKRWIPWFTLAVCFGIVAVHNVTLVKDWMLDDAFISFRYAQHLAEGYGPVFNRAGDAVEGYTTFLWVVLLALGRLVGIETVLCSKILGVLFGAGTLALLAHAHRFVPRVDALVSSAATLFLATFGVFHPWLTSGMENALFGFLVLLALLLHFHSLRPETGRPLLAGLGVTSALMAMARPEGLLVFALILIDQGFESLCRRQWRLLYVGGAFLLLFAPYFTWRYLYYGYLLPNTFYNKVGASWAQVLRGWRYTRRFAWPAAALLMPSGLALFIPPAWWKRYARAYLLPLTLLLYTGYIIAVGGDVMAAFRFFAPLAAPLCLMAAMGAATLLRWPPLILAASAIIIGFNGYHLLHHPDLYTRIKKGDAVQRNGTQVGRWLKEHAPPNAVLATNTAGTIPYYSELTTIDMLGLNDAHIAHRSIATMGRGQVGHEKGDGKYVLSLKPDYIQFGSASGRRKPKSFLGDREIYRDPVFKRDYVYRQYRLPSGLLLHLYERKASKAKLKTGSPRTHRRKR